MNGDVTILNKLGRGGIFEQRPVGGARRSHRDSWEKVFPAESTVCAQALGEDQAWYVGGRARRPVWLEQSERVGREGGGGRQGEEYPPRMTPIPGLAPGPCLCYPPPPAFFVPGAALGPGSSVADGPSPVAVARSPRRHLGHPVPPPHHLYMRPKDCVLPYLSQNFLPVLPRGNHPNSSPRPGHLSPALGYWWGVEVPSASWGPLACHGWTQNSGGRGRWGVWATCQPPTQINQHSQPTVCHQPQLYPHFLGDLE